MSVVSEGIATALQNRYQLVHRPLVLRNMPNYQPGTFRKVGTPIGVLYHGVLMPNRGLEATIQSVRRWRGEFTLTLRGPGQTGYRQRLVRLVRKLGLENRVVFASPVPMTELVREAGRFDVGLFALPGHSRHNRYALPNKFFEYVMAGLALCVTELPEMSALLKKYDLGVCMLDARPDTIAATINALTAASIEAYKRNALSAARELNWDRESQKLISAYEAVISGSRQTGV